MAKQNAVNKKGFTLMELLIVVVIIGVITSIAVPIYKKAVEKSRASDALTTMQAVAKSEHDWFLVKNKYTKNFSDLDINLTGEIEDEKLKTTYYNYELLDKGIMAYRTNGEYSLYKDYEISQIMCSPSEHYICENFGKLTKEPCQKIGMAWANSNSTCYATEEARCKDLHGNSMWKGTFCGYTNDLGGPLSDGLECYSTAGNGPCNNAIINDGGICHGSSSYGCNSSVINGGICAGEKGRSCNNVTINQGGICHVQADTDGDTICGMSEINSGGICDSTGKFWGCASPTINSKGVCKGGCAFATINDGGICEGTGGGCIRSTINSGGICRGIGTKGCASSTVEEGGECWAENVDACGKGMYGATTYVGTGATSGCCRGKYCPSGSPRCECTNHETACDAAPTL